MSNAKVQMTNEIQISKLKIQMEQSLGGEKTSSEREFKFFRHPLLGNRNAWKPSSGLKVA
jgi:hypothetical protein